MLARIAMMMRQQQVAGYSPSDLFAASEQGAWYDPSDLSTMFQDSAGTVPVTAVGQPVGLIRDKSGRNNHASQITATKRPLYQVANGYAHLAFDGIDDALATNSINFTASDKMTVWTGVRKFSEAVAIIVELSTAVTSQNGAMVMYSQAAELRFGVKGSTPFTEIVSGAAAPVTKVITGIASISTDVLILRSNGAQANTSAADQGTGNFGNYPLFVGARDQTSLHFTGNIYSMIIRGAQSSEAQIASTENYINSRTGAF